LAKRIDIGNQYGSNINLTGIMVGNGVMSFLNNGLTLNSLQFMIEHRFLSYDLMNLYQSSCLVDGESAGCQFFSSRYSEITAYVNP